MKKAKLSLSLAAAALGIGSVCLLSGSRGLKVYEYKVKFPELPKDLDGLRIVHLSDMHCKRYGENDRALVDACAALDPDIIVFTGDLYSRSCELPFILSRIPLMQGLKKLAPVYYIRGNHEGDIPDKADVMDSRLREIGINVLRNSKSVYLRGSSRMDIYGLELSPDYYRSRKGSYRSLPKLTAEDITRLIGRRRADTFSVLLAHNPLHFKSFAEWGADLTFSGHVHGGMIRLFGIGLLSPERKFFPKYTKGHYREGSSHMILSTGLGKFRVNNPEMIAVCVLERKKAGKTI